MNNLVNGAFDMQNTPLPLLQKIKKGILYIPNSYTITKGVAFGLNRTLLHLEDFYNT